MSYQPSSYYPGDNQCLLFQQDFSSPKLSHLPLSQVLPDNSTSATTTTTTEASFSNLPKVEQMKPAVAQPPSTILSNSDFLLTSPDLFTSAIAPTDIANHSSNMLTTLPQSAPGTTAMYMNDPATATAAVGSSNNGLYELGSSSILSTSYDRIASPALDGNTPVSTTLYPTSAPLIYSNPSIYENDNNQARHCQTSVSSQSMADKAYSFVDIPGMHQRKRPRRRYDEIERLYHCTYPACKKSYGTLNHLNSHVLMQNHGPKRHPAEFKEMRKEWRRQRKQKDEQRKQAEKYNKQQQEQQLLQPPSTLTAAFQPAPTYNTANFTLQSMPVSGFY